MRTLLAVTAVLGLGVSSAFAGCGHDTSAAKQSTQTTASLDMSTTASTAADEAVPDKVEDVKKD